VGGGVILQLSYGIGGAAEKQFTEFSRPSGKRSPDVKRKVHGRKVVMLLTNTGRKSIKRGLSVMTREESHATGKRVATSVRTETKTGIRKEQETKKILTSKASGRKRKRRGANAAPHSNGGLRRV